jgi:hypothetical protein
VEVRPNPYSLMVCPSRIKKENKTKKQRSKNNVLSLFFNGKKRKAIPTQMN